MTDLTAVIFDYYETLASLPAEPRRLMFDDLAARAGRPLPPGEAYERWKALAEKDWRLRMGGSERPPLDGTPPPFVSFREIWTRRGELYFRQMDADAPPELGADAYRDLHIGAPAYPGARPVLDALRATYRLALLSDADDDFLLPNLERNGLEFEAVVTSEEAQAYKPHISLFREVCARLDIEPSAAAYVGDNPWADMAGARNAGLRSIWINRHGNTWPDDIDPPDAVITSLTDLLTTFRLGI